MDNLNELLRGIPKMDVLMSDVDLSYIIERFGASYVKNEASGLLDEIRRSVRDSVSLGQSGIRVPSLFEIKRALADRVEKGRRRHLHRVINATGIVLHTNLGRAIMNDEVCGAVREVMSSYTNLEYDEEAGIRGSRYTHVGEALKKLFGCEASMVVNNNAAAVLLILTSVCKGKKVLVSRGELVEIGGAFRVPEIMELGGAVLCEVGTTNKTHIEDYEAALDDDTAAILKVHTSNFKLTGFTGQPEAAELKALAAKHNIPFIVDLGSGLVYRKQGVIPDSEHTIGEFTSLGADIVCFSGDKLLGGPQAGIIVGRGGLIDKCKKNQLARALRPDKMLLAALEATLEIYSMEERVWKEIPVLSMLAQTVPQLRERAERMVLKLRAAEGLRASARREKGMAGGGSLPGEELDTVCVAVQHQSLSAAWLQEKLRRRDVPIIARVSHDALLLDVRTIKENEEDEVCEAVREEIGSWQRGDVR